MYFLCTWRHALYDIMCLHYPCINNQYKGLLLIAYLMISPRICTPHNGSWSSQCTRYWPAGRKKEINKSAKYKKYSSMILFECRSYLYHNLLFHKCYTGVPHNLVRFLDYWYNNQSMCVMWAGIISTTFRTSNALCSARWDSFTLFIYVYVDEMSTALNSCNTSCEIGNC